MDTFKPVDLQSDESVTPELTEEAVGKKVAQLFSDSSFMVVEDDPRAVGKITQALQEKRGTQKVEVEEDSGIGVAYSVDEVEPNFKKIIEKASQSPDGRIIVIEDMELPLVEDGGPDSRGGEYAMEKMVQMVNAWNNEHPDRSFLRLEIIMNSSLGTDMVGLNQRLGGGYIKAVARPGPGQKQNVVQDIEGLFRKHLEWQSGDNNIGGKRASVAQAVTTATAGTEGLKERPKIEDIQWMNIDDDLRISNQVDSQLRNGLNMKESLGSARSVEGGINLVRSLAEKKVRVDLIILDQEFFTRDNSHIGDPSSYRRFLYKFRELKIDPSYRDTLGETKVVMYSGTFDPKSLGLLQQEYDFVVGSISKDSENMAGELKVILTQ